MRYPEYRCTECNALAVHTPFTRCPNCVDNNPQFKGVAQDITNARLVYVNCTKCGRTHFVGYQGCLDVAT
jgi:hypothetical protein